MDEDEVWEVLQELGGTDRWWHEKKIEFASEHLDSKEAVRKLDELIDHYTRLAR